jgi:hypothetical protein
MRTLHGSMAEDVDLDGAVGEGRGRITKVAMSADARNDRGAAHPDPD